MLLSMVSVIFSFANVSVVVAVQEKMVYWTHFKTPNTNLKIKIRSLSLRWLSVSFGRSFSQKNHGFYEPDLDFVN